MTVTPNGVLAQIQAEVEGFVSGGSREHAHVLTDILEALQPFDFRKAAGLEGQDRVAEKTLRVLSIREITRVAKELDCGLCQKGDFIYAYNGQFWQRVGREDLEYFLGRAVVKLGVNELVAADFEFKNKTYRQFVSDSYLPEPPIGAGIKISLLNGTFVVGNDGAFYMQPFRREDFLTYQLQFNYDPAATFPRWQAFLDEVLPDTALQNVLAEYIGYVFARDLKLEKTLFLYGGGANGKSVVFDAINQLLGSENVSNYSLESISEQSGYYRAMIAHKLLNYSSDISDKMSIAKFKILTSNEPIEARLPYGQPVQLTRYARLMFNCNTLPRDVEFSEAYFRRFLIIPFNVTISADRRNPNLAKELFTAEAAGIFNWALEGLSRLLVQGDFSSCEAIRETVRTYQQESDTVFMFVQEEGYSPSSYQHQLLKTLYLDYRDFCKADGAFPVKKLNFRKRLEGLGYPVNRGTDNKVVVWLER
ncbi:MAG: DNA primase [Acidobacteria bacterium]|nr:DNA primase [Acidobacteriota bacterium]